MSEKSCDRCQTRFNCSGCGSNACWCMNYPAIFNCATADAATDLPDRSSDCVCPQCLTQMTQAHIAQTIDLHAVHSTSPKQALAYQGLPLIEGLDYTIENGLWIFSRWYFLKQGKCCGNACRNCPYGHINVIKATP
jgi:Family of unknown function (DUF5522)